MVKVLATGAFLVGLAFSALASQPPDSALWNSDQSAAVSAIPDASGTRITAYLKQQDGTFLTIDLSAVEKGNFGKLGQPPAKYQRFETKPTEWHPRQDGLLQVTIQTQAWLSGQRYTVSEPLILRPDGTVIGR